MSGRKFTIAFSTIGTGPFRQFLRLVWTYPVGVRYWWRCFLSGLVSLIAEPFRWYDHLRYSRRLRMIKMPKSPVFILGHWRSGTTLLHNLMCQDDQFAYVTTYQGVFTNVFFGGRWLFKSFMKIIMPEKRPADNVKLSTDFPQEEEFALGNLGSYSFYNFWYFPRNWKSFYKESIACHNVSKTKQKDYERGYEKLIAQSLYFHGRSEFISKDPPNTGRIKQILSQFPNARFIYLYRNPLMVYQSTLHFFGTTLLALQLHKINENDLEEMIFELYENIIRDYEAQKSLIPEGQLLELRYEEFIKEPLSHLQSIYKTLGIPHLDTAIPAFKAYLESQKKFEKAKRSFSEEEIALISDRLGFAMKLYGYP